MTASLIPSQSTGPSQVFPKSRGTVLQSSSHHTDQRSIFTRFLEQEASVTNRIILLGGVLTLGNLADIIHKSSRVYLFQQALCLFYYNNVDPTRIQHDFRIDEALCKVSPIQSRLATVDGIDSFLSCLPPLLVLAAYRELLPRVGLRRLVLLNLLCSGLGVLYSILVFWLRQDWAIFAALLSFTFNLVGGGAIVRITIVDKCIADFTPPKQLTNSFNYISGFYFLASVGGSSIGSLLLSQHVYLLNFLSIACYVLTACVSGIIPSHYGRDEQDHEGSPLQNDERSPQVTPDQEYDNYMTSQPVSAERVVLSQDIDLKSSPFRILLKSWHNSYQSLLSLFSTPIPTSTILLIYLLNGLATRVEVLLPQYTSLLLSWPLATVNAVIALKNLVTALFLFMLPAFRRTYLEPRMSVQQIDLFITQMSLVANTLGVIGLGVSAPAWFFVLSLCIYTSGMGLADSLTSYGTFTLPAGGKVAEFYMRMGLISTIASLVAGPLWSALFSTILRGSWLALGLPFWLCAGLFGAGIMGVAVLKR